MSDLLKKFLSIPTASIAFGQGDSGIVDPKIKPMWKPMNLVGTAITIDSIPGDNLAVHIAISNAPKGTVIVLDTKYHKDHACVGDIIIRNCIKRGLAGFVTNGVMRDLNDCRELGLPIYATGVCMRSPSKKEDKAIIGKPIIFGGVSIENGDYIIGDDDGLVVVKKNKCEIVLKRAIEKESKEKEIINKINNGENTIDIFGLN
ncbi:MAG: 4-hydroxy-4-methyl-2-oxoglutarate aldolase/4-carboxy-4-hydroxy-2-oxoadipate aldolase [Alphaproteobacteria bacterium MarineAlpha2_Bin1]|nr:MAG: 4-hydroxy-4-methyl-2-oxoglutarate aldolase/4-carboxy-4-hydroxy-2-oxoadipate aldolase [Alphaproteobacteria bacterium MarineAlpha2_Bin1]